jgi:hypothetical protein
MRVAPAGDNTYTVAVGMQFLFGGTGQAFLTGTLDHNVFPPAITGVIAQSPGP